MPLEPIADHLHLLLFLAAIALERWLPLVTWYHPFTLVKLAFVNLVKRTFHHEQKAFSQYLASTLALGVILLVCLTLMYLFLQLVYYPQLLSAFILYLCLDSHTPKRKAQAIYQKLNSKQKGLAKALLAGIVCRQVNRLSVAGITKATLESTTLRYMQHYFCVILLYWITGALGVLAYRLITLLHQACREQMFPNSAYLKPINALLFVLQLPACGLLTLCFLAANHTRVGVNNIKHYGRHFYNKNTGVLLSAAASALAVQLGGPAIYQQQRFEKMRISLAPLPTPAHIPILLRTLEQINAVWLLVITLISVVTHSI